MDYGVITVRTSSSRLKSKCLLPFGKEPTVIEHVIQRALNFNIEPIICTSTDSTDDILEQIARKKSIKYFRGSLNNKLKRWLDCANYFNIESFHTVDADDPFFDGNEMVESLLRLNSNNLDFVAPSIYSSNGGATVGYSIKTKIISDALVGIDENADTEMMWYLLERLPGVKTEQFPNPNYFIDNLPQLRLTLDYKEDYWLLCSLARILGNNASNSEIYNFLQRNPDFYKINDFRNSEWKNAQVNKKPQF